MGGTAIPEHVVYLDSYWIDQFEVTNLQYKRFCDAVGYTYPPEPAFGGISDYFISYPDYPVVNVSWDGAVAYSAWAGKRLPTEAEWERAAKGDADNRLWPWGNTWIPENANVADNPADNYEYTSPVGSYLDGTSPVGCFDMAGNVWEWCSDWYDLSYYSSSPYSNPQGPISGSQRIRRGGAWISQNTHARCSARNVFTPANQSYRLGFRCAKDL